MHYVKDNEGILQRLNLLPENKKDEVLDFIDFLLKKNRKEKEQKNSEDAIAAVNNTWGSVKLDRETLKYIAEDKELEYET